MNWLQCTTKEQFMGVMDSWYVYLTTGDNNFDTSIEHIALFINQLNFAVMLAVIRSFMDS